MASVYFYFIYEGALLLCVSESCACLVSIRYSGTGSYIQMFVSHRVGSGNLTLVLWKSNHWVISPSLPAHVHYPTESSEFNLALYKEHEIFFPFLFTLETDRPFPNCNCSRHWLIAEVLSSFTESSWDLLSEPPASFHSCFFLFYI